jgi:hypothetical protein
LSVISKVGSELCDIDCGMAGPYLLLDYLLQMNAAEWRDEWWPRNRYGSAAAVPQGLLVRQDMRRMAASCQQLRASPITRQPNYTPALDSRIEWRSSANSEPPVMAPST